MSNKIKILLVCLVFFLFISFKDKAFCEEYKLFTGVIHLDSTISGDKLTPQIIKIFLRLERVPPEGFRLIP